MGLMGVALFVAAAPELCGRLSRVRTGRREPGACAAGSRQNQSQTRSCCRVRSVAPRSVGRTVDSASSAFLPDSDGESEADVETEEDGSEFLTRACSHCAGAGLVPCSRCDKVGFIWLDQENMYRTCAACVGRGQMECPMCNGDGKALF